MSDRSAWVEARAVAFALARAVVVAPEGPALLHLRCRAMRASR